MLGLAFGVLISGVTYFNDAVINQTDLIGNHLPIAVFGTLMLVLLVVNPLLGVPGRRLRLRAGELAVVTAIGLAACGWPGSGFFRTFTTNLATPAHLIQDKASWQEAHVMSYVPGASARLGNGHIQDWEGLVARLDSAREPGASEMDRRIYALLPPAAQRVVAEAAAADYVDDTDRRTLLQALNVHVIANPGFYESVGRERLPDEARSILRKRESLQAERAALRKRQQALESKRREREAALGPDRQRLLETRSPLWDRRDGLARTLAELQRLRDEARQEIGGGAANGVAAAMALEVEARLEQVDAELRPLDEKIQRLADRLGAFDNRIRILEARRESLTRRIGTDETTGRIEEDINRALLESQYPAIVEPQVRREGPLLAGGDSEPFAVGTLQQGWTGKKGLHFDLGIGDLPWKRWWPTLRLWGGLALLVGTAALCMVLIVHPQWSKRELLAYPIARFVEEATRTEGERRTPKVLTSRLFWYAFVALIVIHLINGLNKWDNETFFVKIPTEFDFTPLKKLFPTAKRVYDWNGVWKPTIYLSVVGFAFFLNKEVSFSLGISGVAYVAFGTILVTRGITPTSHYFEAKNVNLMVFGAYLGTAGVLLYIGRRYYLNVAASALGLGRRADTPVYAMWAARVMVICLVLAVGLLSWSGLTWPLSMLLVALVMLTLLIITRVNVETGAFFIQAFWLPLSIVPALLGKNAVGPQAFMMLGLASLILVGDPREAVMPFLANGLRIGESAGNASPRKLGPWLMVMLVVGFIVALVVTLSFQYNMGFNHLDPWATRSMPESFFNTATKHISHLSAHGELASATGRTGLETLGAIHPQATTLGWIGLGLALVIACSIARLRISWWFIHPVMFVIWGTMPGFILSASFFIGWAVKAAVVKLGGAKGYRAVKPLMVGVIAGELVAAIGWAIVGAIYYGLVGKAPEQYPILPG
jgi:hypothetical protein